MVHSQLVEDLRDFLHNPAYEQVRVVLRNTMQLCEVHRLIRADVAKLGAISRLDAAAQLLWLPLLAAVNNSCPLACSQAIQDALIASGVSERLSASGAGASEAQQQQQQHSLQQRARAAAGTQSSAQSTISLNATFSGQLQDTAPASESAAGRASSTAAAAGPSQQAHMGSEVSATSLLPVEAHRVEPG